MYPRAPYSPPPKPVTTRFFAIVGGDGITEPRVQSMTRVRLPSLPVAASSATSAPSRRPTNTRPLANATPRLLTSQQAYWSMPDGTSGEYRHFTTPVLASTAKTFFGPCDEVTYIVSPITSGVDSCERSEPSWSTQATLRVFTLAGVIWVSVL